jgi:hypothetical protein
MVIDAAEKSGVYKRGQQLSHKVQHSASYFREFIKPANERLMYQREFNE